ncbi:MAG: GntR family transcriptional regulator [Anaerovoracaceae bacterium]|jgi:DNA-binding GntR family transcriptional regulator
MAVTVRNLSGVQRTSVSLSTDLSMRLKEDILSGRLRKNQKLTEQSICDNYQVSRTPVREALVQLEMEGLVESIPNRGSFVVGLSQQDMLDILTLRKIYEVQATSWAIERITEDELDQLEENFEFMEFYTMKEDVDKMLNINQNFHQMIYTASHNRMLMQMLSSYQVYLQYARKKAPREENYLTTVLDEHRKIFEAFKEKDPQAGAAAMAAHMDHSARRYISSTQLK